VAKTEAVVFLIDVDNTLLDNDRVIRDLRQHLEKTLGDAEQKHYWSIFDELREKVGYADYLGAIQKYRCERPCDSDFLRLSLYLLDYPFADRLYPHALDVVGHLQKLGPTVIVSDGDVVFQPRKIERSGIWLAVEEQVLIYIHKEQELEDIERKYPARHYVMIDDKLRILSAVKRIWGSRVTTVFVRQGHYADDPDQLREKPGPDHAVERLADILELSLSSFVPKT
jgi:FMN phosphatase YigB (HAD superfamily)